MTSDLLDVALNAARAGAQVLRKMWGGALEAKAKQRFDFVTEADLRSQEAVLAVIRKSFPDQAVLAEEDAGDPREAASRPGPLWVVDPLDGTTNFIHGLPQVAVSVALCLDGRPQAGVVIDVTREEEFRAVRGRGAWLGETRLKVTPVPKLSQALLLTGFPFRDKDRLVRYLELFKELFKEVAGVRRPGAAALDLAWVAAGRAQGFWELGLKPWDMAAGILLIEEAGGRVSAFDPKADPLWDGNIIAGDPKTQAWMEGICRRYF